MTEYESKLEEEPGEAKQEPKGAPAARRGSRSLFAPVVLIAAGVFFLLDNVGVIGGLNWPAAWSFWPLALIFVGLNVLVVPLRPPLGTVLSGLLGLAAVSAFGYLLLSGSPGVAAGRSVNRERREEAFSVPLAGVESAEITLDLGNAPAEIGAADSGDLISGSIFTTAGLDTELDVEDGHADYEVGERSIGFSLNPADWGGGDGGQPWTFALNPAVPIDLTIDAGNGITSAELSQLLLSGLAIDGGNAALNATLPDGDYDVAIDGGNAGISLALPAGGTREVNVDGGNAPIHLFLPVGVAARVVYDGREGGIRLDERFALVSISDDDDEDVYQTDDYDQAADRVLFVIDGGNSPVTITSE